ncbi:MAG: hypothetical protein U0871_04625 [Gemmataceae bacterium]
MSRQEATSVCIVGPDGTGKSLLALHLVSDYWRRTWNRTNGERPKVLYASTDLSIDRADIVWRTFWLNRPVGRRRLLPFEAGWQRIRKEVDQTALAEFDDRAKNPWVELKEYRPAHDPGAFARMLADSAGGNEVAFLDLEATTAGDDWGLLHALLASLPQPATGQPRHLLVVDAVEGLEILVGERDAFGEPQSRRGRIAQLVRAAGTKCHLVFVVEDPVDGRRQPEEFVSDVVVRCRSAADRDYRRRTVELEKVRSQAHIRGEHEFRIRQRGTWTGEEPNPDDPEVGLRRPPVDPANPSARSVPRLDPMPYIHVFPSLHQLNSTMVAAACPKPVAADPREWRFASLGVHQIDLMLATARPPVKGVSGGIPDNPAGFDERGIPAGSITTLIGNDSTHKSKLARAFLAQCFRTRHEVRQPQQALVQNLNLDDPLLGQGAAILLATYPTDRAEVEGLLKHHLIAPEKDPPPGKPTQADGLKDRLIVRQLPNHFLPPSVLAHIVKEAVAEAKRLLSNFYTAAGRSPPPTLTSRVRLVIDDWTTILATYPEIARDPLILPHLIRFLRLEGVTAMILATRSGNPNDRGTEDDDREVRELRLLADHHLLTWHVRFYGERRVAMTALPSLSAEDVQLVRELRPGRLSELPPNRLSGGTAATAGSAREQADADNQIDPEALVADPHFELYRDLGEGRPIPIPVQVQLYAEQEDTPAAKAYLQELQELFGQVFGRAAGQAVVLPHFGDTYERLRELSYLQSEAKLDHTLVLQVDEFWAESRSELRRQERYLRARTVDRDGTSIRFEDPFQLFGLTKATKAIQCERKKNPRWDGPLHRYELFDTLGYKYEEVEKKFPVYKVPFTWDFGFLVCNRVAWEKAFTVSDHRTAHWRPDDKATGTSKVGFAHRPLRAIWDRLWKVCVPTADPKAVQAFTGYPPTERVTFVLTENADVKPVVQAGTGIETRLPVAAPSVVAHWVSYGLFTEKGNVTRTDQQGKTDAKEIDRTVSSVDPHLGMPRRWAHEAANTAAPPADADAAGGSGRPPQAGPRTQTSQPAPARPTPTGHQDEPVSWREFLGACVSIARHTKYEYVPFDLDLLTAESFACLVFEVWMSEVYQAVTAVEEKGKSANQAAREAFRKRLKADRCADDPGEWAPRTRRHDDSGPSLQKLLGKDSREAAVYRRALYRTLLLLNEVFTPSQLADRNLAYTPRPASPKAAASRQWYSTAANALHAATDRRGLVVAGLPGHFSVRGDWFLATARGSRSPRLGERVIDLLCSRRGNVTRLQSGMGLPVRVLSAPGNLPTDQHRVEYRTALPYVHEDGREEMVHYHELRKLGAYDELDQLGRGDNFFWFWRSTIRSYDYQAHIWQKWLAALTKQWRLWPRPVPDVPAQADRQQALRSLGMTAGQPWWDGFVEYDYYRYLDLTQPAADPCHVVSDGNPRWTEFDGYCDALLEALDRASNLRPTE